MHRLRRHGKSRSTFHAPIHQSSYSGSRPWKVLMKYCNRGLRRALCAIRIENETGASTLAPQKMKFALSF